MAKKKTKSPPTGMIQTALWLPAELYELLKQDGRDRGLGERGLGEVIRRRLEASYEHDDLSGPTQELMDAVKELADVLGPNGTWHKDAFTFAVFREALVGVLEHWRPQGEPKFDPATGADLFNLLSESEIKVETASRIIERATLNRVMTKGKP